MKVLLVGNYPPDAQQSMLRFGEILTRMLRERGLSVAVVRPRAVLRRGAVNQVGALAKWFGYVDKYILFPRELGRRVHGVDLVHVLDHSNALYMPRRGRVPWVATCHDLLAVRGALGDDTDCPASALGRWLQRSILTGLTRARAVACDSGSTLADLVRLDPETIGQLRRVILLGQNRPWRPVETMSALARLGKTADVPWAEPFLLHVGSNLRRKNKAGVVRVLAMLRERWRGNLIFCGAPLTAELDAEARAAGVRERIYAVPAPDDVQLEAAYSRAHALLFPSKCEGFGWPIIEAQACGCPVICSDRTSLPEVAGHGALLHALNDEAGMAESVVRLDELAFRAALVEQGFANLARFRTDRMVDAYRELYEETLAAAGR